MRRAAVLVLLAACSSSPTRTPVRAPAAPALTVESCNTLGDTSGAKTCALYDTQKKAFVETAAADPLARRAFLYDRWTDLYNSADRQVMIRHLRDSAAPGDPESKWGAESQLASWDDQGDSAGFSDNLMDAVLFRYAVTGTEADYQRFESWLRGVVNKFDATGMDGYLARWFYGQVPDGTQLKNGLAMDYGGDNFPIPTAALDLMPAWFKTGLPGIQAKPSWNGHVSIDAYSGPMNSFPLAYGMVRDPALKARMARHYGCFLKRLKIFKLINLSKNTQLQADLAHYLQSGILSIDPGDPDIAHQDSVWGFYLPQYNVKSAATFPAACPDHLATDALPGVDTIDVTVPGWDGKLLNLIVRQSQGSDEVDSIEFAFFPSIRSGDAIMLQAYALGAYQMTGDPEYLHWRDQILIGKGNAHEVAKTIGSFEPPRPCHSYFRTPNIYLAQFMWSLLDGDPASRDFQNMLWTKKWAPKEMATLRDALFEVMMSGVTGQKTANLPQALEDLAGLGGAPGFLDDPRRNYAVDLTKNPPPGITIEKASAAELAACSQPITILGITIPVGSPDPNTLYSHPAPPIMQRPPDNWNWEKDPFQTVHVAGDAGHQQYFGLDYTEPYWVARYFGLLPDAHLVLAWK